MKLTIAQRTRLQQAVRMIESGQPSATWPLLRRGLERSALERLAQRLCDGGYLRPYVHGGYEVTAKGRAAAAEASAN